MKIICKVFLCVVMALLFYGCKSGSPTRPSNGQVSLTVMNQTRAQLTARNESVSAYLVDTDSIKITRARLLLNSIDFEGGDDGSDDDDLEFSTKPMVVAFGGMDTAVTVAVANVPFGSYDEVEIEIYPLKLAYIDSLSSADSLALADFIGNGYSIIIDGMVYNGANVKTFTFSSAIYVEQEYEFNPPLTVDVDNPSANITLMIYSMQWFRDFNGGLLDPLNPASKARIAQNIQRSFWMFEDDDGDGEDDD